MSDVQLELPIQGIVHPVHEDEDLTIQERFERFHDLNPWVYQSLEMLTRDWLARGRRRIGMKMLTEVLRWQYARATVGDDFKLNNNFTSRYVRLLIANHPEWAEAFETRRLRAS